MENKKTIFNYIGQIFMIFGISILVLNVFCVLFGEDAKGFSTMFALGSAGLSVPTMLQFLGVSACIVGVRYLFFTDALIKNMSIVLRTVCMLASVVAIIGVFIKLFGWFPANMWKAWLMFFLCFGISFVVSMAIAILNERMENRKMKEALERLKKENEE